MIYIYRAGQDQYIRFIHSFRDRPQLFIMGACAFAFHKAARTSCTKLAKIPGQEKFFYIPSQLFRQLPPHVISRAFMILPIYSVIEKMDRSLLEAAQDLGAGSARVFRKVILPLSLPGVLSGVTMVFVPSVSTFAISRLLGGGTQMMLGDLIEQQFLGGAYNPHLGAAISLVMMVIVVVCMVVMNHFGEGEEQAVML